tara:strand:+ start:6021 stop:7688 length:1668 start_codon:yes stop_codon:yes gene_type:complete
MEEGLDGMLAVDNLPRAPEVNVLFASVMTDASNEAGAEGDGGDEGPVQGAGRAVVESKPRPEGTTNANWVSSVLVIERGVLAALPAGAREGKNRERMLSIDSAVAGGRSWWWLWRARRTRFARRDSYQMFGSTTVYRTTDLDAIDWLPEADLYGGTAGFEALTAMGASVAVQHFEPLPPASVEVHEQMSYVGPRVLVELEAAAAGIAPAVLGMTLVYDRDTYGEHQKLAMESKSTREVVEARSTKTEESRRIVALVTVTQFHSYRLADMLKAYRNLDVADNHVYAQQSLHEMSERLAQKIRELAMMGYIKLNITPHTVVCIPEVSAGETEEDWSVRGFRFHSEEEDIIEGMPMLWDFDPRFVKRFALGKGEYDTDSAYALMVLVLLASARAEYGDAYVPLYRQFMGLDVEGKRREERSQNDRTWLPEVFARMRTNGKHASFCHFLRSWRPTYFRQAEPALTAAFEEVARDFGDIVRSGVLVATEDDSAGFDAQRVVFPKLLRHVTRSIEVRAPLFAAAPTAEQAAERDQARRDRSRLLTVVEGHKARWRERAAAV